MNGKPSYSIVIGVIDPTNIDAALLDKMNIDLGIRGVIADLLRHGYNTTFSCEGDNGNEPYIAYKRGTGDGTFENKAKYLGLKARQIKSCCSKSFSFFGPETFCNVCGASRDFVVYGRSSTKPFSLEFKTSN